MSNLYEPRVIPATGQLDQEDGLDFELSPQLRGQDLHLYHPRLDSGMSVGTGITRFLTSVKMLLRRFTVDLPTNVAADVLLDGSKWFTSPGNETGDEEFTDLGIPVRSKIITEFNNTSGVTQQARMGFIGPPDPDHEFKKEARARRVA